jgi:predicted amidohydrolase YtcJ
MARAESTQTSKEPDLTILESDPSTSDPELNMTILVDETWVAGEQMFG